MRSNQNQVIPEEIRTALTWESVPAKRRTPDTTVSIEMRDALLWVAEVVYCRFEFARCAYWWVLVPRPTDFSRLFSWTFSRKTFLGAPGEATYLDDLRKDIERADKKGEGTRARAMLRYFMEISRCPLHNFDQTGVLWKPVVEDFFPDPYKAAERLREYCYQLIEVTSYLTKEIGVRPGALLPVWIQTEAKDVLPLPEVVRTEEEMGVAQPAALPVLGIMDEDPYIAQVLNHFIAWEYGHDPRLPTQPPRERTEGFFCRAVTWGRAAFHRWLKEVYAGDLSGMAPEDIKTLTGKTTKDRKRKILSALPDDSWLKDYPLTFSDEIRGILDRVPVLGIRYKRNFDDTEKYLQSTLTGTKSRSERSRAITDLVNDPAFRKDVVSASQCGSRMIHAGYKNLWRL